VLVRRLAMCLVCCLGMFATTPVIALGESSLLLGGQGRVKTVEKLGLSGGEGAPGGSSGSGEGSSPEATGSSPAGGGSMGFSPVRTTGSASGGAALSTPTAPPTMSISLATPPFQGLQTLSAKQWLADAQSRTAYAGLNREGAVSLARRMFGIEKPSWVAPGSESGSRITRYLSADTASEERPGGNHVLVQSTLPLQVDNGSGEQAPVSATLHESGDAYVPANPLTPISISKDAATGASFLATGISVAPVSATATEAPSVVGNRLMWVNTATDTDFISQPMPGGTGVEDSWQLRSAQSPEDNALVFKLSPGASLRMSTVVPDAAEVVMEGHTLLLIPPASAHGADGDSVPVSYGVNGNILTVQVDLSNNVDFPVMVDPEIIGWYGEANGDNAWQNWYTYSTCGGCFGFPEYPNLIQTGAEVGWPQGNWGEWYTGVASSNAARITRVDVTNITHQPENQASFNIGIAESNGDEIYSENGFAGATGLAPLVTDRAYAGQAMAFCADSAGGHDDGNPPLCNESYGGTVFYFADYLLEPRNVFNWASISSATIRYIQSTPPTLQNETYILMKNTICGSGTGKKA
jgi:hypothetical protein